MERIMGISFSENNDKIIVTYLENKEKIKKIYDLTDSNLINILKNYKEEINEKLLSLDIQNKNYHFWKKMLLGAGIVFGCTFIYTFLAVFMATNPSLWIIFLSVIFLATSYFETNIFYDPKSSNNQIRMNQDLEKINHIMEKIHSKEFELRNNHKKNDIRNHLIDNLVIRKKLIDMLSNFKENFLIKRTNIVKNIKDFFSSEFMENDDNLVMQTNRGNIDVQKIIAEMDSYQNLKKQTNNGLDNLEKLVQSNSRRGKR